MRYKTKAGKKQSALTEILPENSDPVIPLVRPKRSTSFWKRFRNFLDDCRSQFSSDPLERCRWYRIGGLNNVSRKSKDQLARAGEEEAVYYLREKGYIILQQNVLLPEGELDIVARKERLLVFLEVKTRRQANLTALWRSAYPGKQRRQYLMGMHFLKLCGLRDIPIRFDVLIVVWPEDAPPTFEHLENAFQPGEMYC